jgi:hypothetical protein
MPRRNSLISRLRHGRAWDEWDEEGGEETGGPPPAAETAEPRSRRRRMAVALTFAALFVAGAAFSAAAGDQVRLALEDSAINAQTASDATTTDATAPASTDPVPAADPSAAPSAESSTPSADATGDTGASSPAPSDSTAPAAPAAAPPAAVAPVSAPATSVAATAPVQQAATRAGTVSRASTSARPKRSSGRKYVRTIRSQVRQHRFPKRARARRAPAPELEGAASAVVYLNRALPDPTPPALRLTPRFARHLQSVARASKVSWALLLGVLRAEGRNGSAPADVAGLRVVASQLSHLGVRNASPWATMFSLSSNASFADRALALSHYYRAVGMAALVHGLLAEKAELGQRVLNDPRVSIYAGGRGDIESGRVNVRVLAVIEYLADSFGQVTVSCLISGHRLYARPGVISAHIYGLAADISEVGGVLIAGHQQPGGVTERAVRDVLLLPPGLMPKQVISLLGLGGPSFPLANHYDHIHIGY